MIKTVATNRYEKELKLMIKRGKDLSEPPRVYTRGI